MVKKVDSKNSLAVQVVITKHEVKFDEAKVVCMQEKSVDETKD